MALSRKTGIAVVLILAAIVVFGGGGWYFYQQANYVSTDNATVQGTDLQGAVVPLTSTGDGYVKNWTPTEGMTFSQGQIVGEVDGLVGSTQIRAPITGTVLQNDTVNGQVVLPGQNLGYMVDLNHLQVVANIDEGDISKVQVGRKVDITVDAYPGKTFPGTVTRIGTATSMIVNAIPNINLSGVFDKVTERVPVYISIDRLYGVHLVPGFSAAVAIHRH
ncbi:HlyD membrane-fusion protein of T1SS [Acididesulfobacillus acetoxydans]|uniref:HlyD membrane-fusion protein of T1SS n=1 Tax=Acididesulfobacillus acetoxydans TaxID=1561005 RepID=A0A8S0Y1L4_9FIRM|nr:efflux RND transporter periplasmic adaptor subunit [Acididesulfobacillus acetoxydans]CAA7599605.1 HlyD membrane-fusion protein of T1SS [Acididesulfobacillus acetoxydans]CEJ06485.1 Secretion protein HlyD protein [Acididesulfobacillus acetoxydans]